MAQLSRNASVSVPNSVTEIAPARPNRTSIYIRNLDAALTVTVWLSNVGSATANQGIVLRPYDYIIDSDSAGYKCWSGAITAIASAAGPATVAVFERNEA